MENQFQTSDLYLAAFLSTMGHEVTEITYNGKRGIFHFGSDDKDKLEKDIMAWTNNADVTLKIRKFVSNIRDLKGVVAGKEIQ